MLLLTMVMLTSLVLVETCQKVVSFYKAVGVGQVQAQQYFAGYNATYFDGKLAPTRVLVATPPDGDAVMGQTVCDLNDEGTGVLSCTIYVNPTYNIAPVTTYETIIHEACHVKTYDEFDDHGPRWQHCMLEQAMSGGFKGIW
jgi:hypothetical protein